MAMKTSNSLHIFSSVKLKALLQTFFFPHMCRAVARAMAKAKSLLFKHVRGMQFLHLLAFKKSKKCKKKLYFGSFRLNYNWCASHVMPLAQETHVYYDASWNAFVPTNKTTSFCDYEEADGLSEYLEWLEEKGDGQESRCNEIDEMADLFIANCHEKFRLEKQESYRRFQEMMERSV